MISTDILDSAYHVIELLTVSELIMMKTLMDYEDKYPYIISILGISGVRVLRNPDLETSCIANYNNFLATFTEIFILFFSFC